MDGLEEDLPVESSMYVQLVCILTVWMEMQAPSSVKRDLDRRPKQADQRTVKTTQCVHRVDPG